MKIPCCFSQKESWQKESENIKEEMKKLEEQKEQDAMKIKAYSVSNFVAFIFQKDFRLLNRGFNTLLWFVRWRECVRTPLVCAPGCCVHVGMLQCCVCPLAFLQAANPCTGEKPPQEVTSHTWGAGP